MEDADKNRRKQQCNENKPTAGMKWLRTGEKRQAGKFLLTSGQECMCSTSHSCDILHAGGEVSPTSAPPPHHSVPPEASDHTEGVPHSRNRHGEKGPCLWMNLYAGRRKRDNGGSNWDELVVLYPEGCPCYLQRGWWMHVKVSRPGNECPVVAGTHKHTHTRTHRY